MPIPDVGLTIRPRVDDSKSRKPLEDHAKKVREIEVAVIKLDKATKHHLDDSAKRWRSLGDAGKAAASGISYGFRGAFSTLDKFNSVVDRAKSKLFDVKTLLTTGLVGAATFGGLAKLLAAGRGNVETQARIRRQFSAGDAALLTGQAGRVGRLAGIDGADRYLIPIMEAVGETRAGTMFRGRKLSEGGAAKVREQTFGTGASLFARIATLAPDLPPEELARMLAEAGSGAGGVSRFGNALGLNRVLTRQLVAANAKKGGLAKFLGKSDAAKYGVGANEIAGQGTLLEVLLGKSGLTEEAATEKRGGFDFQLKSIGAQLEGTIGTIGERAFHRLNAGLAKGGNLAEKLQNYLESPKGQKAIDKIADTVSRIVGGMADLAEKIPAIIDFLDKHSGKLLALGGAFVGARVYGQVKPLAKDAGGLLGSASGALGKVIGGKTGGILGKVGSLLGGAGDVAGKISDANAMPVRVVNWGDGKGGFGGGLKIPGSSGSREIDLDVPGAGKVGLLRRAGGVIGSGAKYLATVAGVAEVGGVAGLGAGAGAGAGAAALSVAAIAAAATVVVGTGVSAYLVTSWLDKKFGVSDFLAGSTDVAIAEDWEKRYGEKGGGNKYASQQNEFSTAAVISRRVSRGEISARDGAIQLAKFAGVSEGTGSDFGGLSPFAQELVRRVGKGETIDPSKGYGAIAAASAKAPQVTVALSSPYLRNPADFVDSIMPELRAQLVNQLQSESGYGAAPVAASGM